METEAQPAPNDESIPVPMIRYLQSSCPAFGAMQRRAMLAELLDVPAHLLGSSHLQQAAHRLNKERRRYKRSVIYRSALRASATSALTTSSGTRDTATAAQFFLSPSRGLSDCKSGVAATPSSRARSACADGEGRAKDSGGGGLDDGIDIIASPPVRPGKGLVLATIPHPDGEIISCGRQQNPVDPRGHETQRWSHATVLEPLLPLPPLSRVASTSCRDQPLEKTKQAGSGNAAAAVAGAPTDTAPGGATVEVLPLHRCGSSISFRGSDFTSQPEAWDRLANAIQAAASASGNAQGHGERGDKGPPDGASRFGATLRRNTAQELHREVEATLEELRKAVLLLPAHRMAWRLEAAAAELSRAGLETQLVSVQSGWQACGGGKAEARVAKSKDGGGLRGATGKPGAGNPLPPPQQQQGSPPNALEQRWQDLQQLKWRALRLLQAHVILARAPFPAEAAAGAAAVAAGSAVAAERCRTEACGETDDDYDSSDGGGGDDTQGRRQSHRFCAALLMDSLLRAWGRPPLPYPELAAMAVAQGELCVLPQCDAVSDVGGAGGGLPASRNLLQRVFKACVHDADTLLRLVRRCSSVLTTRPRLESRSPGTAGAVAQETPRLVSGGDGPQPCSGAATSLGSGRRSPTQLLRQNLEGRMTCRLQRTKPYDAVWPLEGAAEWVARVHVAAVLAALEECGAGPAATATLVAAAVREPTLGNVRAVYEQELMRRGGGAFVGARESPRGCGSGGSGGDKTASPSVKPHAQHQSFSGRRADADATESLQQRLLHELQQLIRWGEDKAGGHGGGSGGGGGRPDEWQLATGSELVGRCDVVGLDQCRALGLWPVGHGDGSSGGGFCGAAASGEAPSTRSAVAAVLLDAVLTKGVWERSRQRSRQLLVTGASALRALMTAAWVVGLMRQATLPHPAAVEHDHPAAWSPAGGDGPVLLGFEEPPPTPPGGGGEGPQVAVSVVAGDGAAGWAVQRLLRAARSAVRRRSQTRAFDIVVPSAGFSSRGPGGTGGDPSSGRSCLDGLASCARPGGTGGEDAAERAGAGEDARLLSECRQQLVAALAVYGCAWLQCGDREALQAAVMMVAEVHTELRQRAAAPQQHNDPWIGCPSPGLEVLPYVGGPRCEALVREARGRIMRELHRLPMRPPGSGDRPQQPQRPPHPHRELHQQKGASGAVASQQQPRLQAAAEHVSALGAAAAAGIGPRAGGGGSGGGRCCVLEDGWQCVRRLALNREVCGVMALLDGGCEEEVFRQRAWSPGGGGGGGARGGPASTTSSTPEGPLVEGQVAEAVGVRHGVMPEACSMLVIRREELRRLVEGRRTWVCEDRQ